MLEQKAHCSPLTTHPSPLTPHRSPGKLYVLEQNSLRGYNYETFNGDVLVFCARGQYDCAGAQNSGESEALV